MYACTFFGHRDCPNDIKTNLYSVLTHLIVNKNVDTFYVGQQGNFDKIVHTVLQEMVKKYPHIRYFTVLERLPNSQNEFDAVDNSGTLIPEGIENVHPRYAISWRNIWMINKSSYVVTYITHSWGGAAKFANRAKRQNKTVINIVQKQPEHQV